MSFERKILQELNCPRCNAWAQLRIEEEREGVCICYIVCNKCRFKKYSGILSRKTVNLISQSEKVKTKLDLMKEGTHKARLRKHLEFLENSIIKEKRKLGV